MVAATRLHWSMWLGLMGAFAAYASLSAAGQATPSSPPSPPRQGVQHVRYHLTLSSLDSSGIYVWNGTVSGAVTGRAKVQVRFPNGPPQKPGTLPLQAHWVVTATPASQSFDASLTGMIDLASGKTHYAGAIESGPWSGRAIEMNSQLFNRGPNGALSASDGALMILPQGQKASP